MGKSKKKFSLSTAVKNHQGRAAAIEKARISQAHKEAAIKKRSLPKRKQKSQGSFKNVAVGPSPKGKEKQSSPVEPRWTIPFETDDRILLLGEGNFSFALALVRHHGIPPTHILATTLDAELECYRKYPQDAEEVVAKLREEGVRVVFGVDATKLKKCKKVRSAPRGWNKVVFNFPHVGARIKDQDRIILTNQQMLLGFLRSVAPFLSKGIPPRILIPRKKETKKDSDDDDDDLDDDSDLDKAVDPTLLRHVSTPEEFTGVMSGDDGTPSLYQMPAPARQGVVLVTLRESAPYTLWDLPQLAKRPPENQLNQKETQPRYVQVRSFRFWPEAYPGYEHRRTNGAGATAKKKKLRGEGMGGTGGICRTWEFVLREEEKEPVAYSGTGANVTIQR